jgi:NNP family nitrate/nitrite transporter-like MFS transporter
MGFQISDLWREPVLNPVNKKARSVPLFNPVDRHGRVFFFSWLGFMLAFWAWYTFPPLVCPTAREQLKMMDWPLTSS